MMMMQDVECEPLSPPFEAAVRLDAIFTEVLTVLSGQAPLLFESNTSLV